MNDRHADGHTPRMDGTREQQLLWRVVALQEALQTITTLGDGDDFRFFAQNALNVDAHNSNLTRDSATAIQQTGGSGAEPGQHNECKFCGTSFGLRIDSQDPWGGHREYVCAECFTGRDDGPCFDDLPEATESVMLAALWEAREVIASDRRSLYETAVDVSGEPLHDATVAILNFYDSRLATIDAAIQEAGGSDE